MVGDPLVGRHLGGDLRAQRRAALVGERLDAVELAHRHRQGVDDARQVADRHPLGEQRAHHLVQHRHGHAVVAHLVGQQRLVGAQRVDQVGHLLAGEQFGRVAAHQLGQVGDDRGTAGHDGGAGRCRGRLRALRHPVADEPEHRLDDALARSRRATGRRRGWGRAGRAPSRAGRDRVPRRCRAGRCGTRPARELASSLVATAGMMKPSSVASWRRSSRMRASRSPWPTTGTRSYESRSSSAGARIRDMRTSGSSGLVVTATSGVLGVATSFGLRGARPPRTGHAAMTKNGAFGMPGMRPMSSAPPAAVRSVMRVGGHLLEELVAEVRVLAASPGSRACRWRARTAAQESGRPGRHRPSAARRWRWRRRPTCPSRAHPRRTRRAGSRTR